MVAISALAALLAITNGLSRRLHLPRATLQFLLGAATVHLIVAVGIDTGLRYDNFHDLVYYGCLPLLLFATARQIHRTTFIAQLPSTVGLAGVGLILTTGLTAAGLYYLIDHPSGFPWQAALLAGILLAGIDPSAVFERVTLGQRPTTLLQGESLLSDATALVLFTVILTLALSMVTPDSEPAYNWQAAATLLAQQVILGVLAGAIFTALLRLLVFITGQTSFWLDIAVAFGAYHAALYWEGSGAIASLIVGLSVPRHADTTKPWLAASEATSGVLFLLMGATFTFSMVSERWLAMLFAIAAVFVARAISVNLVLTLIPSQRISLQERLTISALGTRGAVTLALALMLPTELPYWWTIQSIAYGVVVFDLCLVALIAPQLRATLK